MLSSTNAITIAIAVALMLTAIGIRNLFKLAAVALVTLAVIGLLQVL